MALQLGIVGIPTQADAAMPHLRTAAMFMYDQLSPTRFQYTLLEPNSTYRLYLKLFIHLISRMHQDIRSDKTMLAKSGRVVQLAWHKICTVVSDIHLQAQEFFFELILILNPCLQASSQCQHPLRPERHVCCLAPGG